MQSSGAQPLQIYSHDVGPLDGGRIKETDAKPCPRDRARTCEIPDAHTQPTTQPIIQPIQRVTFNLGCNRVYDLPLEDRKSDSIRIAADRFRFQRLTRHLEKILGPLLQKKTLKH
jgi:hypothetical protein